MSRAYKSSYNFPIKVHLSAFVCPISIISDKFGNQIQIVSFIRMKLSVLITAITSILAFSLYAECAGHGSQPKKKHGRPRAKQLLVRSPRGALKHSDNLSSMCDQVCSKGSTDMKGRRDSTYYDPRTSSCLCTDKSGAQFKRIMKKVTEFPTTPTRRLIISRGNFHCNKTSPISQRTCKVFCQTFKQSDSSECSNDGRQCLCYAFKDYKKSSSPRVKRQTVIESNTWNGDEIIAMDDAPHQTLLRQPKFVRHGPYDDEDYGHGPHGHHEIFHDQHSTCSPYTCIDQCPHDCDSLCRFTGECYCSCPQDIDYEYYDDFSPFGAILG